MKPILILIATLALLGASVTTATAQEPPTRTLRINLNQLPEGDLSVDGVAYNTYLNVSSPDGRAQISHSENEFFSASVGLFPGQISFDFKSKRVDVVQFRYEVFNNNATSRAMASSSRGGGLHIHPDGLSSQTFADIGNISRVDMQGLESVVGEIVVEFQNASPREDSDGDGRQDSTDNCIFVSNRDQRDTDGDGHGNVCDADLNNDDVVNFLDLGLFRKAYFADKFDEDADFNGDGAIDRDDLEVLKRSFLQPPGPSAPV